MRKLKFYDIPNILTILRVCFIPVICVLLYLNINLYTNTIAITLIIIACLTDFLDGKMARKYNIVSAFGRCMDPIADKLLVMALILVLVYNHKIWLFPAIIVLFREIFISGMREFLSKDYGIVVHVSQLAKIKTATQMFSLIMIIICQHHNKWLFFSNILFTISSLLTLITAIEYIVYSYKEINKKNINK